MVECHYSSSTFHHNLGSTTTSTTNNSCCHHHSCSVLVSLVDYFRTPTSTNNHIQDTSSHNFSCPKLV